MSIKTIFRSFMFAITVVFLLLSAISYGFFNIDFDVEKIDILQKLDRESLATATLDYSKNEINFLRVEEQLGTMKITLNEIRKKRTYDYVEKFFLQDDNEKFHVDTITKVLEVLIEASNAHYNTLTTESMEKVRNAQLILKDASDIYAQYLIKQISKKNNIFFLLSLASSLNVLMILLWYARKLSLINKDIVLLVSVDKEGQKKFYTQEASSINQRMTKGGVSLGSKSLLDPLTEIPNEKGFLSEFAHRDNNNVKEQFGVAVFDVDNLKELEHLHGRAFTDSVLKKIAFILNLEKRPSDIIARIGDDEFVCVFTRADKDVEYAYADNIRKEIEKIKFKTPKDGKITVTISGGFVVKDKYDKLDAALQSAHTLLKRSKLQGRNVVTKLHNFDHDKNSRM